MSKFTMDGPCNHAHIDCTHGLTARSLYDACYSLACDMKLVGTAEAMAVEVDEPFQIFSQFGIPRTNHQGQFLTNDHDHWIEILQSQLHQSNCSNDSDAEDKGRLPRIVLEFAIHALTWLTRNENDGINDPSNERPVEFAVVGSIWWFHRLGIHASISSTPLPCSLSTITKRSDLYKGLPITLTEIEPKNHAKFSLDGVALLKALLAMGKSERRGPASPPSMTLRFVATGLHSTTIVVGHSLEPVGEAFKNLRDQLTTNKHDSLSQPTLWDFDQNLSLLETNVDDITSEHLSFAAKLLMQHVAVADCWITPIAMKKGRPAHTLHCLCNNKHRLDVLQLLFRHVPTLGVRIQCHAYGLGRVALRRSTISVPFRAEDSPSSFSVDQPNYQYEIDCKVAYLGEDVVSIKAEFDQCKRISLDTGGILTLSRIGEIAVEKARDKLAGLRKDIG